MASTTMRSILGILCLILYTVDGSDIVIKPIGDKQTKALGGDHVFTCVLNAPDRSLLTNFRWLDPRNVTIDANYRKTNSRIYTNVLGGLGNQLQLFINKLTKDDGGPYTCAANYGANVLVATVTVEPYRTITFIDAQPNQSALMRNTFKIKCQVEAMPPPMVEWTRNNVKLQTDQRYTIEPDGLVIKSVTEEDDGEYRCEVVVLDTGEVRNQNIHLEVIDPPQIINKADKIDVTEGEKASLKCEATGKPKPTITWVKSSTRQVVSTGVDGILYIEKVSREESNYTCDAKNTAGDASRVFQLNVRSKPDVYDVRNGTAEAGRAGQIQCYVYGNPKPSVVIRKYTLPRSTRSPEEMARATATVETVDNPKTPNSVIASLNFPRVELSDDGLYECLATNEVGQSVRSAHLTVEYAPIIDPAVNSNVTYSWDRRPVNLSCIAEAIPNATITWYFNNIVIERSDNVNTIFSKASPSTLQVKPLSRNVYGAYKCKADNKVGKTEWTIQLKEAFPPSAVENIEVNATTATSLTFKIMDPSNTGGLPVRGYVIQYMLEYQQWNEAKNETWARGALYSVHNLLPGRSYNFRIAAVNEVGLGPWSRTESRKMPEQSYPSEPIISNAIDNGEKFIKLDTATSFELRWNIPSSNGVDIDSYKLKYCPAGEDAESTNLFPIVASCVEKTLSVNEALSSYIIKDLNPDSYYLVSLRAHNNIGDGPASERFFKTSNKDPKQNTISTEPAPAGDTKLRSDVLIYTVVAILIAVLVIIDVFCFFCGKTGLLYMICGACCGKKSKNTDDKLGTSETKDLISNGHNKKIDIEEQAPMIIEGSKKETAVEYDPKKGTAKTGFVGKDSAV